jgi:hypothetical protein
LSNYFDKVRIEFLIILRLFDRCLNEYGKV